MTDLVERGMSHMPVPGRRAPGSVDVARLAGVSQKTVSRVLNDEPYVSAEARRKVLEAAEQLGYRRNNAARALTSGRTHNVGVVTPGTALYGPTSLLLGLERAARGTGYALRVANTEDGGPAGIAAAVESLLEQGVDGIVISEPIDEGDVDLSLDVPVLVLGHAHKLQAPRVITAGINCHPLAGAAVEHLLGLGHATVHHVAGPQQWYSARERTEGWAAALAQHGRAVPAFLEGDWSAASGYAAGQRLAADRSVTAVFAANDDMAFGLVRALVEHGRRVPEDISVIGFDDIPLAAYLTPPLTTFRQPFTEVAAAGLDLLLRAITTPLAPIPDLPTPEIGLTVRASTAPPPRSTTGQRRRAAPPAPSTQS